MLTKADIMTRISNTFGLHWNLNEQSLNFLQTLSSEDLATYDTLLERLESLCKTERPGLLLQAWHIDNIISSWQTLEALPLDILSHLDAYLLQQTNSTKIKSISAVVEQLRTEHKSKITAQAEQYHLQHHTVYHALEIKIRAMRLIVDGLNLLNTNSPRDVFLRKLISFMIEFHDYEQKEQEQYACVEQKTANQIADWFIIALNLHNEAPTLIQLIKICSEWVIVLGTTMIWGPNSTMDLIELFLLFNQIVCESGIKDNRISNQSLGTLLSIVAIIAGLCDKNPATSRALMEYEARLTTMVTYLQDTNQPPSLIEQFLSNQLTPYFSDDYFEIASKQAWRTTWPPHFNMRLELSLTDPSLKIQATEIIQLLKAYQNHLLTEIDTESLSIWLDNECPCLQTLLESLFFNKRESTNTSGLTGEQNFSLSQMNCVRFASEQLAYLLTQWDQRSTESTHKALMIEPNCAFIDAQNIAKLEKFYDQCSNEDKKRLCYELFSIAVQQMGFAYTLQNRSNEQTNPARSCCLPVAPLLSRIWCWRSKPTVLPEAPHSKNHSTTLTLSAR